MRKCWKQGVLLCSAVVAVCAFAMPSMATAASWGVIGTEHTLDSPNLGFTMTDPILGPITSLCFESSLTADVTSAAALRITHATFRNCTSTGPSIGDCTATPVATTLPWTATGVTSTNVQIHGIHLDWRFETKPGSAQNSCANVHNQSIVWTGTLTGGHWTGNGAGQHEIVFSGADGVVAHGIFGIDNNIAVTWSGTFRDTNTASPLTLT